MPTTPEIRQVCRDVRRVEVRGKTHAEQERRTDRDVRVAREVAIDLHRVRVDAHEHFEAREVLGTIEDAVDQMNRELVRKNHFLHEPERDQKQTFASGLACQRRHRFELRKQITRTNDGTRNQMREERDEEQVTEIASMRGQIAAIHIDHVAHRFEREERNADGRQKNAQ